MSETYCRLGGFKNIKFHQYFRTLELFHNRSPTTPHDYITADWKLNSSAPHLNGKIHKANLNVSSSLSSSNFFHLARLSRAFLSNPGARCRRTSGPCRGSRVKSDTYFHHARPETSPERNFLHSCARLVEEISNVVQHFATIFFRAILWLELSQKRISKQSPKWF